VVAPPGAPAEGATVVLELVVGDDGDVDEARVLEGDEPFASAALAASRRWRFEPARRAGAPVAARIRFEVAVRAPRPGAVDGGGAPRAAGVQAASGAAGPAGRSAAARSRGVGGAEVRVRGVRTPPGGAGLSRGEVRQLPGAFGDPFRALEAMPGVTPIVSGLPYFYVRGAPPGNVGYFLDGVRVPYLYHVALGPSVIHPALVERVDLYPGGYPARYGRFAGGIVAGETAPPRPEWHGEANVRLFDAGALVEAPFANGRGSALVGGRYSFTAAAVSLLSPETAIDYRDYQARVAYDLGPRDRVSLFSFGAYDLVGEREGDRLDVAFGGEFYRVDARYDHGFGRASNVRAAVTLGFDQSRLPDERNARDRVIGARVEVDHAAGEGLLVRAGADVMVDDYEADLVGFADPFEQQNADLRALISTRTDVAAGARADVLVRPWRGAEVVAGLRADVFRSGSQGALGLDPRLAATLPLGRRVRAVHAFGLAHQAPSFVVPVPGLGIGGFAGGGLQRSLQASSGAEADLGGEVTATATVFKNAFFAMTDAFGTTRSGDGVGPDFGQRSLGSAYGLELFARRRLTSRLGGFVTYTLSRSTRSVGREKFAATFDRAHVLNAAVAYGLGRGWRAGGRFVFYTGLPRAPVADDPRPGAPLPPRTPSAEREPPFYRIDVRLEKRWTVGRADWVSLVIEFLNATLHRETLGGDRIGPISVPSVGVEAGF
jgi:TonB family protein